MKDLNEEKLYEFTGGEREYTSFIYDVAYCIAWGVTSLSIAFGRNAMKYGPAFK
jgi:hypothetical protein